MQVQIACVTKQLLVCELLNCYMINVTRSVTGVSSRDSYLDLVSLSHLLVILIVLVKYTFTFAHFILKKIDNSRLKMKIYGKQTAKTIKFDHWSKWSAFKSIFNFRKFLVKYRGSILEQVPEDFSSNKYCFQLNRIELGLVFLPNLQKIHEYLISPTLYTMVLH